MYSVAFSQNLKTDTSSVLRPTPYNRSRHERHNCLGLSFLVQLVYSRIKIIELKYKKSLFIIILGTGDIAFI